jgi:hypothetical protein
MTQNADSKPGEKILAHVDIELKELIPGFLENRHRDVKSILKALDQGDYETPRILGHTMKGLGGGYGFSFITYIGSAIEQAAKDKYVEEIRELAGELINYLERVEVVYE